MENKISFLDIKDFKKIKNATENHNLDLIENDVIELNYYSEVINSIQEMAKYRRAIKGWNHYDKHYSRIDFTKLLEAPYFGSVKIFDEDRVYIGKQSYFDISNNKQYVYDWRSSFGTLFYNLKKHAFIEKRHVVIENIREYVNKYVYFDKSSKLSYIEFLNKALENKKTKYLEDVIATIDEVQNDILRDNRNKLQIIEGGPGTGKTTMGLHILSYLSYQYIKKNSRYPKICIVLQNDWFKKYINNALKALDLTGKNYHQTVLLNMEEFLKVQNMMYDYIYIDEAQDLSKDRLIKVIDLVKEKVLNIIITIDPNQRIKDTVSFEVEEIVKAINMSHKISKIERNYRNPENIANIANSLMATKQECVIRRKGKVFFSLFDKGFLDFNKIKKFSVKSKSQVAVIYSSDNIMEKVVKVLETADIEYHLFENDMDLGNKNTVLMSLAHSKGLEFDKVILFIDCNINELIFKRNLYVAMTRTLSDIFIISNDFIDKLGNYEEVHPFKDKLEYSYALFKKNYTDRALIVVDSMAEIDENVVVTSIKKEKVEEMLQFLLFLHYHSKRFDFSKVRQKLSSFIIRADLMILSKYHEVNLVDYNYIIRTFDLTKHKDFLNHIDAVLESLASKISANSVIRLFNYIDYFKLIKIISSRKLPSLKFPEELKQRLLLKSIYYHKSYMDYCLDLGIFNEYEIFIWGIDKNRELSKKYFKTSLMEIIEDVINGNEKVIAFLVEEDKTGFIRRHFLSRLRFKELKKFRKKIKKLKTH